MGEGHDAFNRGEDPVIRASFSWNIDLIGELDHDLLARKQRLGKGSSEYRMIVGIFRFDHCAIDH